MGCRLRLGEFVLNATEGALDARGDVRIVIRPERVEIEDRDTTGPNRIPGLVERVVYVGPVIQLLVRLAPGISIQAMFPNRGNGQGFQQGSHVVAHMPASALRVLERRN